MPVYEHGDFRREAPDVPPELAPLVPLLTSYHTQYGCGCSECNLYFSFSEAQRAQVQAILAQQRAAQRELDLHIDRLNRCGRCGSRIQAGSHRYLVDTAEGTFDMCYYCRSNLYTCEQCDQRTTRPFALHQGVYWCQGCTVDADLASCWCGALYDLADSNGCPQPRGQIHSYSYRPLPVFYKVGDGTDQRITTKGGQTRDLTPYMGFELEVSFAYSNAGREAAAGTVTDIIGNLAYLKEDGSISDGFELVTHPMTLEYAIHRFPWHVLGAMDSAGGEVHDGLGLHIHVSKAAFESPSHEYRWLLFWHRNYRVMSRLARRDNDEWAAWTPDARQEAKRIAKKESDGRSLGRYQAINTSNEHTHEIRIFQASLVPDEIIADLALVSGTVEYCRELDSTGVLKASGWEFATFAAWAAKRPVYAALTADIARHFPRGFRSVPSSPGRAPARASRRQPDPRVASYDFEAFMTSIPRLNTLQEESY